MYIPFFDLSVWSLIKIRLPVARVIPSTAWPFAKAVLKVPFAVVATRTDCFTSKPCNASSSCCLFTASVFWVPFFIPVKVTPALPVLPKVNVSFAAVILALMSVISVSE